MEMKYHKLDSLPADVVAPEWTEGDDRKVTNLGVAYLWSGQFPVPAIGSKVVVSMNGLGPGKVEGYFVEGGWLGVLVSLTKAPKWLKDQCKRNNEPVGLSHIFGTELEAK